MTKVKYLKKITISILAVVLLIGIVSTLGYAGKEKCSAVRGGLVEQQDTSITTTLVTNGEVSGTLVGNYHFELSDDFPSQTTGVNFFDGVSTITTKDGKLALNEAGALTLESPGIYSDLQTVDGSKSTDKWSGAAGKIWLTGNFDLAIGKGVAEYNGVVCTK